MLTCQQMTELTTDYLDGRLTFMQRMNFHMHVGMCSHCRAYLRQMKLTIAATGRLPRAAMPPEVRDELMRRFRDWKGADDDSADPSDPSRQRGG